MKKYLLQAKNLFEILLLLGEEDIFCADEFSQRILDEEPERDDKESVKYKALIDAVNKTYVFTSMGVPMLKSSFHGLKQRLSQKDEDR